MNKSDEIKYYLLRVLPDGRDIIIPNFYLGAYEMDICLIKPSGFVYEYEIKISKSDFRADFKKGNDRGYSKPKHERFISRTSACNRFYFVVPNGLIDISDVPKYAGLIFYNEGRYHEIVKNAPLLHREKCRKTPTEISQLLGMRERQKYQMYRYEKSRNMDLREYIHQLKEELRQHDPKNIQLFRYGF